MNKRETSGNPPVALLYSPGFDGHRQVYVFVLANILEELGYKIVIAGDLSFAMTDSPYLVKLKANPSVTFTDTGHFAGRGLKVANREFVELQDQFNAELTVFAEADHHIALFNSQISKKNERLRGRRIGIFLRPFYFYQSTGFVDKLRYVRHLNTTWRHDNRLFHEYLLKRYHLLDAPLFIDEYFVSRKSYRRWLPDVFQQFAETLVNEENCSERGWITRVDEFKAKNSNRFMILYFGTAQNRRGYDLLLKIAAEQDACFIHCGLSSPGEKFDYDVDQLRKELDEQGRLLETNQYISDPACIEHFFRAVTHLPLPYRDFYGSSGVMLQALRYGIPVLVPEDGIMGYRTKKYNLGLTYNDRSGSLGDALIRFKSMPKESFELSISQYMRHQDAAQLKMALEDVFTDSAPRVELP